MTKSKEVQIPFNFKCRDYQQPLYDCIVNGKNKRAVCVWHRRAGKDKTLFNMLLNSALQRVGVYFYFLPTYNQGRKIIWDGIDKDGFRFLAHAPGEILTSKNSTQMQLHLINGSIVQIVGTDNIDSIVGTNPVGCVFSEWSLQDPMVWDFIRPILLENDGWAAFNFTPRGRNHGWKMYQVAKDNPSWFCQLLTVEDTGVVSLDDIDQERKDGMSEEMIRQEFYCDFDAPIVGSYYAEQLTLAEKEHRICGVPYTNGLVDVWFDLGFNDSTTMWFSENAGREVHIIDYYENSGEALKHYAEVLRSKPYTYGRVVLPHDGANKLLSLGMSIQQQLKEYGITAECLPRPRNQQAVFEGIEKARRLLGYCWFDEKKCEQGIFALKSYHKEFDEKNAMFKDRPVHDWSSHAADAFRYLAMGHRFGQKAQSSMYDYYQQRAAAQ